MEALSCFTRRPVVYLQLRSHRHVLDGPYMKPALKSLGVLKG